MMTDMAQYPNTSVGASAKSTVSLEATKNSLQ